MAGGLGEENVPGVAIGMKDPVLAAFVKQLTNGGESTTADGGGWVCGEE
jgi:hypothetical protein